MEICKCEGRFEPKSLGTPGLENQYFPTSQESISILLKRSELDNRNISHVVSKVHHIYAMVMTLTPQYYPSSHRVMSHILDRRVTESDKFPEAKKQILICSKRVDLKPAIHTNRPQYTFSFDRL
jgi:hypothetical protein